MLPAATWSGSDLVLCRLCRPLSDSTVMLIHYSPVLRAKVIHWRDSVKQSQELEKSILNSPSCQLIPLSGVWRSAVECWNCPWSKKRAKGQGAAFPYAWKKHHKYKNSNDSIEKLSKGFEVVCFLPLNHNKQVSDSIMYFYIVKSEILFWGFFFITISCMCITDCPLFC